MALGTQSVLGISSNLTWDVIEQMKDLDVSNQIDPITKKIEKNMEQQTELTSLLTMMTSLNTSFKNLSDYSTYQRRQASVDGNGVKATAGDGLAIQDITINVSQLAQNDVNQVGLKFASRDSVFSNENTTLDFYHNGTNYSIDIKAGMTLSDVAQSITDATNGEVMGIIMKTGGDNPYQLMIQSKNSGADNKVYFGSTLESAAAPGGKITQGTLEIEIGGQTISVDMKNIGSDYGNTAEDNAKLIVEAINKEIEKNPTLKDKVDSGEITIGLNSSGKGIMLNDSSGGAINVNVKDVKFQASNGTSETATDLGFSKKSVGSDTGLVDMKITAGALNGIFTINGKEFDLSNLTKAGNTAEQNFTSIMDAINNDADLQKAGITASGDSTKGTLTLNSNNGQTINIAAKGADASAQQKVLDSIGLTAGSYTSSKSFLDKMDITNIQKAQDAKLTYNGIPIERDTNSIDDIVSGLSLELTSVTETGKDVIVRIARDDEGIAEEMKAFVESYNEMYNKLQELTKYDEETEIAGVFNGNSEIRSITRQLNSIINSTDANGNSLIKYGVYMNEDGTLTFEEDTFNTAFKEDPDAAVEFFRSSTKTVKGESVEIDGVFTQLRNTMDSLITGSNSTLKILESTLVNEQKTLNDDKTSTQESIDNKYDIMAERWSAYDQMIAQMQQSSNTITQLINQSMNS
ncbi:flagellar filament capping protein FliD [Helicobacter canadensis]|uniref:Flagellar hook-associated protein 2 n=1 Tax=Helicobacter canadensis MIT 98-5491 TaxID=537970 RepID=C5ZWT4_9HELI|nr:flagellar filament capping protein FliD [Helicobacter canadensis]EES89602.1 flagellar hook-associated protein [Helicobacter canadensis MIT 98-5491]EFR48393.1 flagellar hook-associated protein 2 [Helicobacter canadensis MIT 98-5491]STO99639.1 flagellar capping protein [Helicobacter canadensis]